MNKRSPNFSGMEEDLLLKLVKKYSHIVENKKTDALSSKEKLECWQTIAAEFNCHQNVYIRTPSNLKNKFENIKKVGKRKFAKNRKYLLGTGGGPSLPEDKLTDKESEIIQTLDTQITGLPHEFDDNTIGAHSPQMKDNIAQCAQENVRIAENQNMQNIEEFTTMMRHREEKHLLQLKLMQEKHDAELALLEKEFLLKAELMREEHLHRLKLINKSSPIN